MGTSIREHWSRDAQGCTESIMVGEVSEGVGEVMHMVGGGQRRSAHGQKGSEGVGQASERLWNRHRGCLRCWELDKVRMAHDSTSPFTSKLLQGQYAVNAMVGVETKAEDKVSCDAKVQDKRELQSDTRSCNMGVPNVADMQSDRGSCNLMDPRERWTRV
jgi:hypothetical protein